MRGRGRRRGRRRRRWRREEEKTCKFLKFSVP